ncbi:hypothetical protein CFP56_016089, partial [Quercus suber]
LPPLLPQRQRLIRLRTRDKTRRPHFSYHFILCIKFLGALVNKKCEGGKWDKIKASRRGPSFSHIFFMGGLLLFTKINIKNSQQQSHIGARGPWPP